MGITSYIDGFRFYFHAQEIVLEGYRKYKPGIFRVSQLSRWLIIITNPEQIKELHNSPELSFVEANSEKIGADYRFPKEVVHNQYSVELVASRFTRLLEQLFPTVHEEAKLAFQDLIPVQEDWVKVKAYDTMIKLIGRASNRVLVGTQLFQSIGRNPEWIQLNINFASQLILSGKFVRFAPPFLRRLVDRLFTKVPDSLQRAEVLLKDTLKERRENKKDRELDYISLLLEEAQKHGERDNDHFLTIRILGINLAAVHSTAGALTQAIFELILHPELVEPIRQEVEGVIDQYGWNKPALNHMRKLDSLLKEVTRIRHGDLAVQNYTFSDGTKIPKGAYIVAASNARHHDESLYKNASEFQGFRFSDNPKGELHRGKDVFAAANVDHLGFGSNRHICPGRFFASMMLKTLMTHILLTYEFKMEVTPKLVNFEEITLHDYKADIYFRKIRV